MSWLYDDVLGWLAAAILKSFDAGIGLISGSLLTTPDVTILPQVKVLTGRSVWVVDTVFVLAFITAGIATMVGGGERSRYTVKDLLPRLVVGFLAAHFAPLVCVQAISVANALTGALADQSDQSDQSVGGKAALKAMTGHVHDAAAGQVAPLLLLIILALVTVLVVATAVSMIVRFEVLLVLAAIAPLGLACHALPATDWVARLWWRAFGGCLITPVLQAFTLQAGQWLLLDPRHLLPELGIAADPGGLINLFVVLILFWTTVKIPGLVRRYVTRGGGGGRPGGVVGQVVRVVVVQQGLRAVHLQGLSRMVRR